MTTETAEGDLATHVTAHGPAAHLVTVSPSGEPHVTAVTVRLADGVLVVGAGSTSRGNVGGNPAVTLLWSPPAGGTHSLLVDGTAADAGDGIAVRPTSALLHRVADAPAEVPRCFRVAVAP